MLKERGEVNLLIYAYVRARLAEAVEAVIILHYGPIFGSQNVRKGPRDHRTVVVKKKPFGIG